jgi:tRNA threonylcarbamoyladenosine dehydratase
MQLPVTRDGQTILGGTAPEAALGETPERPDALPKSGRRFDRAARLFSEDGLERLAKARVLVVGVGGVGSFAAESLVRSGVGRVVLVDFDRVCVTNSNRQLHTMQGTIGRPKVDVMAERLRLIHPLASIEARAEIYSPDLAPSLLSEPFDFVIDAIDAISAKVHLIATCVQSGMRLVSAMGAAARMDPTAVRVADLSESYNDPLAALVRKRLRQEYGLQFERGTPIGVPTVFSVETPVLPHIPSYDQGTGFRCVCPGGKEGRADCDNRKRIDGSASFVTGTFGLTAASVVVRELIHDAFDAAEREGGSTVRSDLQPPRLRRLEAIKKPA